jgi:hypothetical protein
LSYNCVEFIQLSLIRWCFERDIHIAIRMSQTFDCVQLCSIAFQLRFNLFNSLRFLIAIFKSRLPILKLVILCFCWLIVFVLCCRWVNYGWIEWKVQTFCVEFRYFTVFNKKPVYPVVFSWFSWNQLLFVSVIFVSMNFNIVFWLQVEISMSTNEIDVASHLVDENTHTGKQLTKILLYSSFENQFARF